MKENLFSSGNFFFCLEALLSFQRRSDCLRISYMAGEYHSELWFVCVGSITLNLKLRRESEWLAFQRRSTTNYTS
jgi:hypothetical protein